MKEQELIAFFERNADVFSILGNTKNPKYKVGDIIEDIWGRTWEIIALRGKNGCGQLYEIKNRKTYIVESNIKGLKENTNGKV